MLGQSLDIVGIAFQDKPLLADNLGHIFFCVGAF